MIFRQKSLSFFCLFLFSGALLQAQPEILKLREVLIHRLEENQKKKISFFPPVIQDPRLLSNATFRNDSIFIGNIQRVFSSFDDSLSILYHEYNHFLISRKNQPKVGMDNKGKILQWDTGQKYTYIPFPQEVEAYVEHFKKDILPTYPSYNKMSPGKKERIIDEMRKDFSKPEKKSFIYSPSNLAKEEIRVYRQQLKGEKQGLYKLSEAARENIFLRIKQKKHTYKMGRAYEKKFGLKQSGEKKI